MDSTPTPTDAMSTLQKTVAPRYAPNCKHAYMNDGFDCPFCLRDRLSAAEVRNAELVDRIAALESELAALRKDVATVGVSDRRFMNDLLGRLGVAVYSPSQLDMETERLAAHVASRIAPVQAELETAVGLLRKVKSVINESHGIAGWHLNCEVAQWGEFEFDCEIDTFLTRHQRDNAQGEG